MRSLGMPLLLTIVAIAGSVHAQTAVARVPDWQNAAGGTMAFEVASVHEDKGEFKPPSFALSADELSGTKWTLPCGFRAAELYSIRLQDMAHRRRAESNGS